LDGEVYVHAASGHDGEADRSWAVGKLGSHFKLKWGADRFSLGYHLTAILSDHVSFEQGSLIYLNLLRVLAGRIF
jgi:hypothetical protein